MYPRSFILNRKILQGLFLEFLALVKVLDKISIRENQSYTEQI